MKPELTNDELRERGQAIIAADLRTVVSLLEGMAEAKPVNAVPFDVAYRAVNHVGMANYAERQQEAVGWLQEAEFAAYTHPAPQAQPTQPPSVIAPPAAYGCGGDPLDDDRYDKEMAKAKPIAWMYEHDGCVDQPIVTTKRWRKCEEPWTETALMPYLHPAPQAQADISEPIHEYGDYGAKIQTSEPTQMSRGMQRLWDHPLNDIVMQGERQPVNEPTEAQIAGLAHEVWSTSQLAPGEGLADGVDRIMHVLRAALAAKESK